MKFKLKYKNPTVGQYKVVKKFLMLPRIIEEHFVWLEYVWVTYKYINTFDIFSPNEWIVIEYKLNNKPNDKELNKEFKNVF